jgi:hypothetical protein
MALTDATAFQLCMANAAMFMAQRKQPDTFQYEKCSEVLEYYGKCLEQITKRLERRDDCASDGVIVTVLGLICHDVRIFSSMSNLVANHCVNRYMLGCGLVGRLISEVCIELYSFAEDTSISKAIWHFGHPGRHSFLSC